VLLLAERNPWFNACCGIWRTEFRQLTG